MKYSYYKQTIALGALACVFCLSGCRSSYSVVGVEGSRIPMTAAYDVCPDENSVQILQFYKHQVDEVMNTVIGHSARKLESARPESPLSNLMADVIRFKSAEKIETIIDVAVMNMGGIRNILNEGEITVGNIYEICPFENALAVLTMKGDVLMELLQQIAAVHGEGLSGAELIITKDGRLLSATVGGRKIDMNKEYRVATIDYLAEGNDRLGAFKKATTKTFPKEGILRDVFMEYVQKCEKEGKFVDAKLENRIVVE